MVRLFLFLCVVLSCQDQKHHPSEERKAGKGEGTAGLLGLWGSQRPHRQTQDSAESVCKPRVSWGAWAQRGVLMKCWRDERFGFFLQVECSHTSDWR